MQLIQGDTLTEMAKLPDKSINLILCDLPYGTTPLSWDKTIPFKALWEQYERLLVDNGAIVLFGSEPFSSALRMSNLKLYKYDWKWEKPNGANFLNFRYQPAKVHEDIMVFGKMATSFSKRGNMVYNPQMAEGKPYISKNGNTRSGDTASIRSKLVQTPIKNKGVRYPRSIQQFKLDKEKVHPTQKPVALLEYLVKTYSNENDVVLDNTMGSGSTGVACINTSRDFIGIELDEKYFKIAQGRIQRAIDKQN